MNSKNKEKCLIPLSMAYIGIMICSDLLVNKPVTMYFGYTTAATFIFPLWFILNDIISEVYGYNKCRSIMLTGFAIQLVFDLICFLMVKLPSPSSWNNQFAFELILSPLFRIAVGTFFAFIIAGHINIYLLTKWKILLSGKHFWLRSIGSSAIGEGIYSSLNIWIVLFGSLDFSQAPIIIVWSYALKLIYTIVLAYPAVLIVQLIRKIDCIEDDFELVFEKKQLLKITQ